MAQQFYSYTLPAENGAVHTFIFEKPVKKILIKRHTEFSYYSGVCVYQRPVFCPAKRRACDIRFFS